MGVFLEPGTFYHVMRAVTNDAYPWRQPFYLVGDTLHTMTLYDSGGTHHVIKSLLGPPKILPRVIITYGACARGGRRPVVFRDYRSGMSLEALIGILGTSRNRGQPPLDSGRLHTSRVSNTAHAHAIPLAGSVAI